MSGVRYSSSGDAALAVHFDERPSPALARRIAALHRALRASAAGLSIECIPGLDTLTVLYDPREIDAGGVGRRIERCLARADDGRSESRSWTLPVCYEGELAPDLAFVAAACGLDAREVVAAHAGREYVVYLLGFSPGFPYMGDLDPRLALPRRSDPRPRVAPGSVAIATTYTAVYPQATAGGWHVIGTTPFALFDAAREPPALLAPGDTVRFESISRAEFGRPGPSPWQKSSTESADTKAHSQHLPAPHEHGD